MKTRNTTTTTTTTTARSWIRLLSFFVVAVVTSGVMPGQNVYSRLFCEAGLFAYACDNSEKNFHSSVSGSDGYGANNDNDNNNDDDDVCCKAQWLLTANIMNLLTMITGALFLVGGILFDALGGKIAALIGCGLNALGFSVLGLLLYYLQTESGSGTSFDSIGVNPFLETFLFVISILLIDAGMLTTNMAFFGFLWHLPHQQTLILSLSNSCTNIAAVIPLIIRWILNGSRSNSNGLDLPSVLGYYVLLIVLVAIPLCWWAVPSIDEYRTQAMEVLGMPIPKRVIRGKKGVVEMLVAARDILQQERDIQFHALTISTMAMVSMCPFIYMTMADPMGQEIFHKNSSYGGEHLATLYNQWNAYLGFFVGPLVGIWVDRNPDPTKALVYALYGILATSFVVGVMCPIASWPIQTLNIVLATTQQMFVLLFLSRYAVLFAPPHRAGTLSGMMILGLGVLGLVPILIISVYISFTGSYTKPTSFICGLASILLVAYLWYIRTRTKSTGSVWPSSPVLLPIDERNISKSFGVGTLEDAAFVAGMSIQKFRKLSSSSKIQHQRELLDASMTRGAANRILQVAKRRSFRWSASQPPMHRNSAPPPQYIIPSYTTLQNARKAFSIERGTAKTAWKTVMTSFNGNGGFGGRTEPSFEWVMSPIGPPDHPKRIELCEAFFLPPLHCCEHYGTILEVRVPKHQSPGEESPSASASASDESSSDVAAVCCCYHPRGLDETGSVMEVGSDRYNFCLASSGVPPVYLDRERFGDVVMQRIMTSKQDSELDRKRVECGPVWYVAVLATHPKHQQKGYGRILLDLVASWASKDGVDCYLECSEANLPYYEKSGYEVLWRNDIEVGGTGTSMFGMIRKHNL